MEWGKVEKKEENNYAIPDSWLFLHYYDALNTLFRIENSLRIFVYIILKNENPDGWLNFNVMSDDSQQTTINAIGRKRMSQAKNYGYLSYPISCPIMHLTTGEIIQLIDTHWAQFKDYFPGSKEIIKYKLDEISTIRNALAHFRPIRADDVSVIKQNANHVFKIIEDCLSQVTIFIKFVPTNTNEDWYKELRALGTDKCTLSFFYSKDEKWIQIRINFTSTILAIHPLLKSYISYKVLNIVSSSVLINYPNLIKFITYLSESIPYTTMGKELTPKFSKNLNFIFSRKILRENHKSIGEDIKNLLVLISEETELILKDKSARGKIVQVAEPKGILNEKDNTWRVYTDNLKCDVKEDDPPEYWGVIDVPYGDIVSTIHKYPWMPIDVAKREEPF